MITIQGTIKKIVSENNNGNEKKVLTLQIGMYNKIFIEFQGKMKELLNNYSEGQRAEVKIHFNGKTSNLGRNYNNIIAKSIKSI